MSRYLVIIEESAKWLLRLPARLAWMQVRFRQADGTILSRWTGAALVYAGGTTTNDEVVFGEPYDLVLLGARSLEGLNLRVDPVTMQLVDAGPAPAAAANLDVEAAA